MSANIEALVKKHIDRDGWSLAPDGEVASAIRNALTEQAEAFKGELQAYDGMVRELTKTVEDMRAAQSVAVVGEPVAWVAYTSEGGFRGITLDVKEADRLAALGFYVNPLVHISKDYNTAAELASLREKAAEADELRKDAALGRLIRVKYDSMKTSTSERFLESLGVELDEDAAWTCATLENLLDIDAAIAQGKGE